MLIAISTSIRCHQPSTRPRKKLFVSCNGPRKNRLSRPEKHGGIISLVKNVCFMHVLRLLGVGKAVKKL